MHNTPAQQIVCLAVLGWSVVDSLQERERQHQPVTSQSLIIGSFKELQNAPSICTLTIAAFHRSISHVSSLQAQTILTHTHTHLISCYRNRDHALYAVKAKPANSVDDCHRDAIECCAQKLSQG